MLGRSVFLPTFARPFRTLNFNFSEAKTIGMGASNYKGIISSWQT
jgi:hypothetical protein